MDTPAPPPGQVRPTQVCKPMTTMKTTEQRPSKGMNTNENNAILRQRKDGSTRLVYSTKDHIEYQNYYERQRVHPTPTDFDMFGLKRSEWEQLLACDGTIKTALTYNAETEFAQRQYQLSQVRKEELMYALRNLEENDNHLYADRNYKGKVYADYLTVQISDGIGTKNEQTAICAAVSLTNLKCIREEDSRDLGFGIFQLSKPRKIAIVPSFDPESLFQEAPSRERLPLGYREFLMVYLDVECDADFISLQNEISETVNKNKTMEFTYTDDVSKANTRNKYMIIHGIEPYRYGDSLTSLLYFTPTPGKSTKTNVLEIWGVSTVESALKEALLVKKELSTVGNEFTDNDIVVRRQMPWFDRHSSDAELNKARRAIEQSRKGRGKGKGGSSGKGGKGHGRGQRSKGYASQNYGIDVNSLKDPPILRHMLVVQGVRANKPLNEFLATISEGHVMNLYVGGEHGFTFTPQKEKGSRTLQLTVNRSEITAHVSWKLHMPDRATKTEMFDKLMGTPCYKPGEITASVSPVKTAAADVDTPDDWEDEFNTNETPDKVDVIVHGVTVAQAVLFITSYNQRDIPINRVLSLFESKGCALANSEDWKMQNREKFLSQSDVLKFDCVKAANLMRFMPNNPFGSPFAEHAHPGSKADYWYAILFDTVADRTKALSMAPMFYTKGLCRLLTISEIDSGILKEGKPEKYYDMLQSSENDGYWCDLMQSTKEQYLDLWASSRGKVLSLPPTYAANILKIKEDQHMKEAGQTAVPRPAIDVEREAFLRSLTSRARSESSKHDKKKNEAAKQRFINMEQRRIARMQQTWKMEQLSAPIDDTTQRQAASIFAADKQREAEYKAQLKQEQAVKLVTEMHAYQSRDNDKSMNDRRQQSHNRSGGRHRTFTDGEAMKTASKNMNAELNTAATDAENDTNEDSTVPTITVNGYEIVDMEKCSDDQIKALTLMQVTTTAEVVSDVNYQQLIEYHRKHAPQKEYEVPRLLTELYADDTRGLELYLFQSYGEDISLKMSDTERARISAEKNTEDEESSSQSQNEDGGHDDEVQSAKRPGNLVTEQPESKRMKSPFGTSKVRVKHENIENTLPTPTANEQTLSARSHSLPSTFCALPSTGGRRL